MIPLGCGYQYSRAKMLAFFNDRLSPNLNMRTTFGSWIANGNYTICSLESTKIVIDSYREDFTSVVFLEVEFLLNSAYEHLLELIRFQDDNRNRSDAWSVVTIYYFGFNVIQALLRLLGHPVYFIKEDSTEIIRDVSSSSIRPQAGCYLLESHEDIASNQTRYTFNKKKQSRLHDICLNTLLKHFEALISNNAGCMSSDEKTFYELLTNKKLYKVYDQYKWPSDIRNKANYSLGFGYRLVEGNAIGKTKFHIKDYLTNAENLMDNLYKDIERCIDDDHQESYNTHVRMMISVMFGYFFILKKLYSDIIERTFADKRMNDRRNRFISKLTSDEKLRKLLL